MRFFFCQKEAFSWKKIVFLSPAWNQFSLDHCHHITSSLSSQLFNSNLVLLRTLLVSVDEGWSSNHSTFFWSSATFLPTCPNTFLFESSRLAHHCSKQFCKTLPSAEVIPFSHASFTTCSHRWSFNHINSNQKGFFCLQPLGFGTMHNTKGTWSETDDDMWYNFANGNRLIHLGVASTLSSLLCICTPSAIS